MSNSARQIRKHYCYFSIVMLKKVEPHIVILKKVEPQYRYFEKKSETQYRYKYRYKKN